MVRCCSSEGGFLDRSEEHRAFTPVLPPRAISYADEEPELVERPTTATGIYDVSLYDQPPPAVSYFPEFLKLEHISIS